ncbi:MAG: hypothetical protein RIR26_1154 [Pseudomonadota bacterium]|jgi:hypothetical protein
MRKLRRHFVLFSLLLNSVSCAKDTTGGSVPVHETGWSFDLTFSGLTLLSDSNGMPAAQLREQLLTVLNQPFRFRDPVQLGSSFPVPASLHQLGGRFWQASGTQSRTLDWQIQRPVQNGLHWAHCRGTGAFGSDSVNCETKQLLECLEFQSESEIRQQGVSQSRSGYDRSLLMAWLRACGISGQFESDFGSSAVFARDNGKLSFYPSPLLSLQIYKGSWANYERAVVNAVAAASIPAVTPCVRSDGACVASPVAESACQGCAQLEKGSLYTVFYIEGLRQDYTSVQSVMYVP